MLRSLVKGLALRRASRLLPIAKVLAIAQVALLARKHVQLLGADDRRRFAALVRRGRSLTKAEREELRALTARLEPKAFAWSAVDQISPIPLPKRFTTPPRK